MIVFIMFIWFFALIISIEKNHSNIPVGVLDTDSDLTQVSPEDFTSSLNTRQHPGEKIRRNTKGNVL